MSTQKIKITQMPTFELEIDGVKLSGQFQVESEWEGFAKLVSNSPMRRIIIRKPHVPHVNQFDLVPKLFGGNRETNKPLVIEVEQVAGDEMKQKC